MHRLFKICAPLAFILLLAACSEAPKPAAEKAKEPEKPAEPVSGRFAFHQMFIAARGWAPDVQVVGLSSIDLAGVKREPGKAAAWQVIFVSPSRNKARLYTYSVVESSGNLHKGVFSGTEDNYIARGQAKPFNAAALKIDSDEALQTAMKQGADYAKKNPNMPISFQLELIPRFPAPAWRVIWGESVASSNFSVYVDASTGKYLQTMR